MRMRIQYILFITTITFSLNNHLQAQEGNGSDSAGSSLRNQAINVFLDCHRCDNDYVKRVIPYVNYVLNRDEADVHILVSNRRTGSGGQEYNIQYFGRNDFEGIEYELDYFSSPDDTNDKTREERTNMIALGLMQFVGKTPLAHNIKFEYENGNKDEDLQASDEEVDDPWNAWVFRLSANGEYRKEESYENPEYTFRVSADRITPDWKLEFDGNFENKVTIYHLDDGDYRVERMNYRASQSIIRSLTDHWSAGMRMGLNGSDYSNIEFGYSIDPGIEYNIFPYHESSSRQIRFQYHMKFVHNNYQDTTIFNKITENLWQQQLSFSVGYRQPWGNANFSITWNNYMHDFEKYNLGVWSSFNIRVYKGLSVNFRVRGSLQRDQIYLLKDDASQEEILLRQRAIASSYDYSISAGLSYTFGSIYNNTVNPRFGN